MEELEKKKSTKKNSSVRKNSSKKIKPSTLDSDALLEEILNKSKKKKAVSSARRNVKKVEATTLSNDDLLDQILAKKADRKKRVANKLEVKSILVDKIKDSEEVKSELELISDNITTDYSEDSNIFDEPLVDKQHFVEENNLTLEDIHEIVKKDDIPNEKVKLKKKSKNKVLIPILLVIILFLVCFINFVFFTTEENIEFNFNKEEEYVDLRPTMFQECLTSAYSDRDNNEVMSNKIAEVNNYISKKYNASVSYEDLSLGFTYSYNINKVYYAASTIKALDGLYIYTKAANGELDLDQKIIYYPRHKRAYSAGMAKHIVGEGVTLRDLVKYAITVSDNAAHEMLVEYIGKSNLRAFGKSLGATYTLYGGDNFGSITTTDALIYAKAINDFINNNKVLGEELQSYLISAAQNGLNIGDSILAGHKYGEYSNYYHDYGIVYDSHPYVIAIMTTEGYRSDFQAVIRDINSKVYELHTLFHANRETVCYSEIYEK